MHNSLGVVIWQAGEKLVKFGKELASRCFSAVEVVNLRISTRFARHSPDAS